MKPKVSQPSENRRKILQGTLAAPMVLTVSSATASTASFARCLNSTDRPSDVFVGGVESPDNWLRVSVPVVQLKHGNDTDWFFFDPAYNDYVRLTSPTVKTGIGAMLTGGWQKQADSTRWLLVWVNQSGTQYAPITAQQPGGYQATTVSCYGSFQKG